MIFNHGKFSEINEAKLVSSIENLIPVSGSLNFMDFGCGIASLYEKIDYNKFILFDQNEDSLSFHKKAHHSNVIIIHSLDELIEKKIKIDVVMFNSVIQYIKKDDLIEILRFFVKNFPSIKIVISDIPKHNRFLEMIYLLFTNTSKILTIWTDIITNIIKKDYKDLDFQTYEIDYFKSMNDFKVEIMNNFYLFRTRYTVVVSRAVN